MAENTQEVIQEISWSDKFFIFVDDLIYMVQKMTFPFFILLMCIFLAQVIIAFMYEFQEHVFAWRVKNTMNVIDLWKSTNNSCPITSCPFYGRKW